jgi:hypothetical protein
MKNKKEMILQRTTVYVLVAVLFAFTGSVVGVVVLGRINKRYPNLDNAWVNFILKEVELKGFFEIDSPYKITQIDWAEQYPFERENVVHAVQPQPVPQPPIHLSLRKAAVAFVDKMKDRFSRYTGEYLFFRKKYVELATTIDKILGLSFMKNTASTASYAILDDNYLIGYMEALDVTNCANSLTDFGEFLQSRNIPLFYIQAPDKVCKEDAIASTRNFANQNADALLTALKQTSVSTLDLRDAIHRQGLVHHDLFLKTDHHWKPETGLWAAKVIADQLNASFNFDIDTSLYDPECYNYQVQGDHLGSIGRRATLAVANPEPITFIFPKFKTDLTLCIPSRNLDERGDFSVTYYKALWEYMSKERDIYSKDYYYTYFYGGYNPVIFVRNNRVAHKKKILLISDSFSWVVAPFLALGIKNMDVLVLKHFTGSVRSFIDQTLPDIVLVLYPPGEISNLIDYNSHSSFFDFR